MRALADAGRWEELLLMMDEEPLSETAFAEFIETALYQRKEDVALAMFMKLPGGLHNIHDLLRWAALRDCPLFLEAALFRSSEAEVDIHRVGSDGNTLFSIVACKGHVRCLDLIIQHGGDSRDWTSTVFRNLNDAVLDRFEKLGIDVSEERRARE